MGEIANLPMRYGYAVADSGRFDRLPVEYRPSEAVDIRKAVEYGAFVDDFVDGIELVERIDVADYRSLVGRITQAVAPPSAKNAFIALAALRPWPMARITVAAPRTISPPA